MALSRTETDTNAQADGVAPGPAVLILGMGVTGASLARYFARHGAGAVFFDSRPQPPGVDAILDAMPDAEIHAGTATTEIPDSVRRIVVSPGFDLDSPVLGHGRAKGLEIISDIDLFFADCTAPVVAVTGSNGKSTVTSMLATALSATGLNAVAGGNIGIPALDLLRPGVDYYVLELSSFQLERSGSLPAAVAVVLNISPDHLDRHGDMQSYAAAKARIYESCEHAVVNRDEAGFLQWVPKTTPKTFFGLGEPAVGEYGVRKTNGGQCIARGEDLLVSVDELPLMGRHNLANAVASVALGAALGVDPHAVAQGLKRFHGLPHRMQLVSDSHGATWIDDSKATNVGAALMSIASVADPFVLIAGGDAKGAGFDELANALGARRCTAILFGKDAEPMAAALADACPVHMVSTMNRAVELARQTVQPGGTVLLAPACSSLDMFDNFAARGDAFAAAIEALDR